MAEWFPCRNNWFAGRFSNHSGPLPARFEDIRAPQDLPPGAVLLRPLGNRVSFLAAAPFGIDLHWLKEVAEGLLRGTTGIRLHSAGTASVRAEWAAGSVAAVVREDVSGQPGLRVALARRSERGAGLSLEGSWTLLPQTAALANPRELASALLGVHPLNWVRALLKDLGSRRVEEFVRSAGASLRAFDALREFWQSLGCRQEAALWEFLQQPLPWSGLAASLASGALDSDGTEPLAPALARQAVNFLPEDAFEPLAALLGIDSAPPQDGAAGHGVHASVQRFARLLEKEGVLELLRALPETAARELDDAAPGQWVKDRIGELFGDAAALRPALSRWTAAARKFAAPVAGAVARLWDLRVASGFASGAGGEALADATFPFTPGGLVAAARVVQGDLTPLFQPASGLLRLRRGCLTETFRRRFFLELHAPMLRARCRRRDLESFASAEAGVTEDGRLQIRYSSHATGVLATDLRTQTAMVFSAALSARDGEARRDHFSLSFSDTRKLDPAVIRTPYLRVLAAYGLQDVVLPDRPLTATLHLRLPGPCVEAWLDAPSPGGSDYLPLMARVSCAVQAMARRWLPALYLSNLDAYTRPSAVNPLLAWSCSPPSSGPKKKDLSYDFMDPKVVDAVLLSCAAEFRERLAETWRFLIDSGRKQTAAYYEPADTRYILAGVKRQHRNFVSLLTADAFLVEAVLNVAGCAREIDRLVRTAPKAAVSEMARFSREMADTFHRKLRRLYAGSDFLALGPLFFLTATRALAGARLPESEIAAVLTVEWDGGKTAFANQAAQRLF